jgi:hypothetical protein
MHDVMMMHKIKRTNNSNKGDFSGSLQPPPEAFSAPAQDDSKEWFLLGLTCALDC